MQEISIDQSNIPLWSGANGTINIEANVPDVTVPLVPGDSPIASATFNVAGNNTIALGTPGSVAIGVKAGAEFKLAPLWKDHIQAAPDLVDKYQLSGSLTDDNMLLALSVGANADVSAAGSFKYNILSAGATLDAGADASFFQVRAYSRNTGFGDVAADFFSKLRLPGTVVAPPDAGEVISFEFGGNLNVGINAAAGYSLQGTKSFDVGALKLSEKYSLSVVGKLAVTANLAGRFSVDVRAAQTPRWASVTVNRSRSRDLQILADLNVGAEIDTQGLPASGKEFLGALIGVRAKNWLNMIDSAADDAGQIKSLGDLTAKLDSLSSDFISKFAGKAVDQLLPAEAVTLMGRLQQVVSSYNNLDQSAIALFDRYFDPTVDTITELEGRLTNLVQNLTSWDQFKGEVDPMVWNIVSQLTNGDPLNWILGTIPGTTQLSLPALIKRANDGLALIKDDAHTEIRNVIEQAKSEFGLDHFFSLLGSIDTPQKLTTALATRAQHFVERLLDTELSKLNQKDLKAAFDLVQTIVKAKDAFWAKFDTALQAAAKQTFSLAIEGSYASSDDRTALIDIDIRLQNDDGTPCVVGQHFMSLAGRGDFRDILAKYQPDVVRLRSGSLTHNSTTASGITINIAGWHLNYQYQEMYKVIVNADQQLRATAGGGINVFTTIDMTTDDQKRRKTSKSEEDMHAQFLLTFLGETHNAEQGGKFDPDTEQYLIDVITSQAASYEVTFTDTNTTPGELHEAMLFAQTLGLDKVGATEQTLAPVLALTAGHYGPITAEYAVRFAEAGLKSLFATKRPDIAGDIRGILKRIVLANYFGKGSSVADVAWLYVSDDAKKLYEDNGPNFVSSDSILGNADVKVTSPIPGIQPSPFSNSLAVRTFAAQLFDVEGDLIDAFTKVESVLTKAGPINPQDLSAALKSFGNVLKAFDQKSLGDNTTFAVFDGLVQLETPAADARSSSLGMTTTKDGATHQLTFLLNASAEGASAAVGGKSV